MEEKTTPIWPYQKNRTRMPRKASELKSKGRPPIGQNKMVQLDTGRC